jgi:hypothetical protein
MSSVEVSSYGDIFVTSRNNVMLNSTEGEAYVHGHYGFYVGCGAGNKIEKILGEVQYLPGPGYGIQGSRNGLAIGAMTQANIFRNPSPDKDNPKVIRIQDDQILIQHGKASITLSNDSIGISGGDQCRTLIG